MSDASSFLPSSFNPTASISTTRAWAHQHVREIGHAVELHFGYDVRDEHWLSRLPYDRLAEVGSLAR